MIREYEKIFRTNIAERNSACVKWNGTTAYIITGSQASWKLLDAKSYARLSNDEKKKAGKQFIRFTQLEYVDWSREHWLEVPDEVLSSYRHDRNRRGVDMFQKSSGILERDELERLTGKNLPDVKTLIPCHFLEEDGQVTAFGHGQCFRIPYKNRICDAVPKALRDETIFDLADAVFGRQVDKKFLGQAEFFSRTRLPTTIRLSRTRRRRIRSCNQIRRLVSFTSGRTTKAKRLPTGTRSAHEFAATNSTGTKKIPIGRPTGSSLTKTKNVLMTDKSH